MRPLFFFSLFLFPVSPYKAVHRKAIVIDTHNEVSSSATMKGLNIEKDLSDKIHSDLACFQKGGVDVQIFSVFADERFGKDTAFRYANREITPCTLLPEGIGASHVGTGSDFDGISSARKN